MSSTTVPGRTLPLNELHVVKEGDRVAQLIIEKIETPEVMEVEVSIDDYMWDGVRLIAAP